MPVDAASSRRTTSPSRGAGRSELMPALRGTPTCEEGIQRRLLVHHRRLPADGRVARRCAASGSPRRSGSPTRPGSRRRWPSGWSTARPPSTCTSATSTASSRTSSRPPTCASAAARTSSRSTTSSTRSQPMEQPRPLRRQPVPPAPGGARRALPRGRRLGAAALVRGERRAPRPVRGRIPARDDGRPGYWSPIAGAEALATRDGVALYDMTPLKRLEVTGPGALLPPAADHQQRRPAGGHRGLHADARRGRRHPQRPDGRPARRRNGSRSARTAPSTWTGCSATRPATARSRSATSPPAPAGRCCGARGPATSLRRWPTSTSRTTAFRYFKAGRALGHVPVTALRLSYVGELGWELYTTADQGLASSGTRCGRPGGRTG